MFNFFGYRNMYKNNAQTISKAVEKMRNNQLTIEDILDEEDLVNDLKSPSFSQIISFVDKEKMEKLLDYMLVEPALDADSRIGHKFPYYACEILCSENVFLLEKYFDDINKQEEKGENEDHSVDINHEDHHEHVEKVSAKEKYFEETKEAHGETEVVSDENDKNQDINLIESHEDKGLVVEGKKEDEEKGGDICEVLENNSGRKRTVSISLENKKPKYLLIDYLFQFIDKKEGLNYVLAGYFAKLFNHLANQRNSCFMNYLFENKELIHRMINHMNRRSITEALYKILISNNVQVNDTEIKTEIYNRILDAYDGNDIEQSQNVCDLLTDSLQHKRNYNLIVKNVDLFRKFHVVTVANLNQEQSSKDLIKTLIKLYENFLKDMSNNPQSQIHLNFNDVEYSNDIHAMMFEEENNEKNSNLDNDIKLSLYIFGVISDSLEAICKDFVATEDKNKDKKSHNKSLGIKRYAELEYIKAIIEVIVYGMASCLDLDVYLRGLIDVIINTGVFTSIISNFYEYEWNNLYQKIFEQIITLIAYKSTPSELSGNVLVTCKFIDTTIESFINQKFEYHSGRTINSGTFASVCELATTLNDSDNEFIRNLLANDTKWQHFQHVVLRPMRSKITSQLLYTRDGDSNAKNLYEEYSSLQVKQVIEKTLQHYHKSDNEEGDSERKQTAENSILIHNEEKEELPAYYDNNFFTTSYEVDFDMDNIQ